MFRTSLQDLKKVMTMVSIKVPSSNHTVDVRIIDTQFRIINGRPQAFMSPAIKGFDRMNALAYSFLVTHRDSHGKETKVLFDLGAPKDWKNDLPPSISQGVEKWGKAGIKVDAKEYLSDIIRGYGIPLADIEAIIWRYVYSHTSPMSFAAFHNNFCPFQQDERVSHYL